MAPLQQSLLEFYFARHCESVANEKQIANGGGADCKLTPKGHLQSKILGNHLLTLSPAVGPIYHSEMFRAFSTASIANEPLAQPLVMSPFFNEQMLGEWEGIPWEDAEKYFQKGENPPHGEEYDSFYLRLKQGLKSIAHQQESSNKTDSGKRVPLIISHGGVWLGINKLCGENTNNWPENGDLFRAKIYGTWDNPLLEYQKIFSV